MDVARLNFSHGDREFHRRAISNIRQLSSGLARPVAILMDLQGIKIRTGELQGGEVVQLEKGSRFIITTEPVIGTQERVTTSYQQFAEDLHPGDRVLLSDGLIQLVVLETSPSEAVCQVVNGGRLAEHQGINLPGVRITAPALTAKDLEDLKFGIEQEVDFLALSFVRSAEDVRALREKVSQHGSDIPIVAKLENPLAIQNLQEILAISEGVMVARGDLGVEMEPEKVPVLQKQIIEQANDQGKLVITATQMLESMVEQPRPTRAEASDVANAVFDGSDALMLSGETAMGRFPAESVRMMGKIIQEAEQATSRLYRGRPSSGFPGFPEAVCDAAYHASQAIDAKAIVAFTQTGSTALLISSYRPDTAILGLTPHPQVLNRLALYWGVQPILMKEIAHVDQLIRELEKLLLERGLVQQGDNLIVLTGAPIVERGHTSLMKLHRIQGGG